MGRGALLTGMVGGIIGCIGSVVGLIWYILSFSSSSVNWLVVPFIIPLGFGLFYPDFFFMSMGPSSFYLFFTLLFVAILGVSLILAGVGFYGMRTAGGGAMGIVGLIFCIIGATAIALLIPVGLFMGAGGIYYITSYYFQIAIVWNWIAFLILGVSLILMGCASIVVREVAMHSGTAVAAGVLSIITGVCGILYPLMFLGFILLFVAFLLWAIVFGTTEA